MFTRYIRIQEAGSQKLQCNVTFYHCYKMLWWLSQSLIDKETNDVTKMTKSNWNSVLLFCNYTRNTKYTAISTANKLQVITKY